MKWVKSQYDRLFEISPVCNQKFISETRKKINKVASAQFQIPNYMNGFEHATIWRQTDDEKDEEFEDNSDDQVV
jgi:hypothetical protein